MEPLVDELKRLQWAICEHLELENSSYGNEDDELHIALLDLSDRIRDLLPLVRERTGYTLNKELQRQAATIARAIRKHAPGDPILPENQL